MKKSLAFVVFAIIAAILNAIVFPGPLESPYAEGVGKAVACWGIAYLITWAVKKNRSAWVFGVSMFILIFMLFVQPGLMDSMVNSD
jgi:NADH:ubiquinone oxidoreductase subunit 3 (subunit A)